MISKEELRGLLKRVMLDFPSEIFQEKSHKLSKRLEIFLTDLPNQNSTIPKDFVMGAFAPLRDEVDWHLSLGSFESQMAFPAMGEGNFKMNFHLSPFSELQEKVDFGVPILVPQNIHPRVVPDIILIPGLGFSSKGERLGRGAGFYDRYLENYTGLKIGLCFDEQLREDIPIDAHDQMMDLIVTDTQIIEVGV